MSRFELRILASKRSEFSTHYVPSDHYTLYGVEASYYAAKIRCYLLRKGIPFEEIQCDRHAFDEVIVPRVGYPVVPVVITPEDETLQDTAEMIDILEPRHPTPSMVPTTPRRRFAAYLMELYADEWLKVPALHYRWCYDYEFAHTMMGRNNDPDAPLEEQRRIGAKIASRFKVWPEHPGATEVTRAAVEASFVECLALLDAHFAEHPFAFGESPCLADCAMMGPLYAHLYRDPYSGVIVRDKAPELCAWIDRMRAPESSPEPDPKIPDTIPDTMLTVLRHLSADYVPVLTTAVPMLQRWLDSRHVEAIPRYAGEHRFKIGRGKPYEAEGMRSIHTFEQWKAQRVMDVFESYRDEVKDDLRQLCGEIEAGDLLTLEFLNRLERQNYKLVRKDV